MNLGAHMIVARSFSEDPRYWLGAALPDLASMGGFRLLGTTPDAVVTGGIAFHHRTDEAFHHHPWFTDLQHPLRETLLADGLTRGAARAIAHVGPELLLDGCLLASAVDGATHAVTLARALDTVESLRPDLVPLVVPDRRDRWLDHLERVGDWRPTDDDQRVEAVARRLHRILQRRPRLAFDRGQLGVVEDRLRAVESQIAATAESFIDDLVAVLTPA